MIRIYIDEQRARRKHRVRVMNGNLVLATFYASDKKDASRLKRFARKLINETREEEE